MKVNFHGKSVYKLYTVNGMLHPRSRSSQTLKQSHQVISILRLKLDSLFKSYINFEIFFGVPVKCPCIFVGP